MPPSPPDTAILLRFLNAAYTGPGWHGTSLKGSLRGVTAAEALAGLPGRKNIWQQALHAAYWKYIVCRALDPETPPFERSPSNWPNPPRDESGEFVPDERQWSKDRAYLDGLHSTLIEIVATLPAKRFLELPEKGKKRTCADLVIGAAHHDLYHTGQIQLLKKLVRQG